MGLFRGTRRRIPQRNVKMPFTRNIELGRVALVNLAADPLYGKLVTIVDFVDMNRVLVDSPTIKRCVISLRRLALTSIVVDLKGEKSPSKETLAAALKAADVEGKWGRPRGVRRSPGSRRARTSPTSTGTRLWLPA